MRGWPLHRTDDEGDTVNRLPMFLRSVLALAVVAFAGGAIAAHASSSVTRARVQPARRVLATPPPAVPALACKTPTKIKSGAQAAPPSQALLGAFGILRRERRPDDALPPEALRALTARGLAPVAPESARLLRTTAAGGKAWIVPVPDVVGVPRVLCVVARRGKLSAPKPREGVAVVAIGDAAAGGGGALDDVVRGRAPASVDACAGPNHDMLSVSGVVPDGVASVFLTAPDGTAVRADVHENGYELVVPRPRTFEPRYVVWTGGDGTPHVQPVFLGMWALPSRVCATQRTIPPRVTPMQFAACALNHPVASTDPVPVFSPPTARRRVARVIPAPALPCAAYGTMPVIVVNTTPIPARPIPARPVRPAVPQKRKRP
jgi:hypothetical protein